MSLVVRVACLCLLLNFMTFVSNAQSVPYGELGLQLGGSYYLGEVNKIPFKGTRPAFGVFYRHSFNQRMSVKGSTYYGILHASDEHTNSEYQKQRDVSFSRDYFHVGVVGEFNFLPFVVGGKKMPYTTYIQGGLGGLYFSGEKVDHFVLEIPFGIGAKFNTNGKFVYGVDVLMQKTFSDHIDFISSNSSEKNLMKQKYVSSDKDWMSFLGIYLAYKIDYPQKCPSFD